MNTAKVYRDINGDEKTIHQMVKDEPYWAAERIQEGEKAIEAAKHYKPAELDAVGDAEVAEKLKTVRGQLKKFYLNSGTGDDFTDEKIKEEYEVADQILHDLIANCS